MKIGYKRLFIFQLFIFILLLLNSFVLNILTDYKMVIFLIIITILFKYLFGFEKDRHRYIKDIIFEEIIFLLFFFIIYYLSGILISFAKTENYYTIKNIFLFIIPIIFTIFIKEFLRYMMLNKAEGSAFVTAFTCILFIMIDITTSVYYCDFSFTHETFLFIALILLPAISANIVCSYISYHCGYKPVIFYLCIISLYPYLLPLIPNYNEYLTSIMRLLLPVFLFVRIYSFLKKDKDEELKREYKQRKILRYVFPALIVAIASGSMMPTINKGDVVIIEKIKTNKKDIEEGTVIAYQYNDIIIVHRLIKKVKVGNQYYFYTQGDANQEIDHYAIKEDDIIGKVNIKIPYIGLPTVWLNNL